MLWNWNSYWTAYAIHCWFFFLSPSLFVPVVLLHSISSFCFCKSRQLCICCKKYIAAFSTKVMRIQNKWNAFCHFLVLLPLSLTKIDVYSVWSITQYGHIQQISNWKPTNVCIYHWHNLLDTNESSLAFVLFYGKHTNQLRKIT